MKQTSKQRPHIQTLSAMVLVWLLLIVPSGFCSHSFATQAEAENFSPDGYRITLFRAPVPDSVPSGTTIDTEQLHSLIKQHQPLLIDVLPAPVKPKDRPDNLLWLPPARQNIPGSHWLPNVGYGALSMQLDSYFKENLQRLTGGDKSRMIVLYCLADCWMSWNAAKRAATEYGYTNTYWYPDGTTGWEAAGLAVENSSPIPMENAE